MFRATLSFVRLLGGWTREDRAAAGDLRRELAQDQYENGSWEDSAVPTAFRIIRLLELGATRRSGAVQRAANWLLRAAEPLDFPGSNWDATMPLAMTREQAADGAWTGAYASSKLDVLARTGQPLAAFLVLRTVPWLIREQGADGLWQEGSDSCNVAPGKAESSLLILRALKRHGLLDALLPSSRKGRRKG